VALFTTTNWPVNALIENIDLGKIGLPELQPARVGRMQSAFFACRRAVDGDPLQEGPRRRIASALRLLHFVPDSQP
jgi:hypothetical protein